VGSVPIARSTLKATPGHAGLQDWGQDIDPMRKSWEIDAEGVAPLQRRQDIESRRAVPMSLVTSIERPWYLHCSVAKIGSLPGRGRASDQTSLGKLGVWG
jgi:hypothetical protein